MRFLTRTYRLVRDIIAVEIETRREARQSHQASLTRGREIAESGRDVTTAQEEHDLRLYKDEQR